MEKVTVWERFNRASLKYDHNHIEDGWVETETPTPKKPVQEKLWKKETWRKKKGYLEEGKVVIFKKYGPVA